LQNIEYVLVVSDLDLHLSFTEWSPADNSSIVVITEKHKNEEELEAGSPSSGAFRDGDFSTYQLQVVLISIVTFLGIVAGLSCVCTLHKYKNKYEWSDGKLQVKQSYRDKK